MTSEDFGAAAPEPGRPPEQAGDAAAQAAAESGAARADGERLNLTDPKAIRALAHPVRWALLEALSQAGTLTATQASEMLGESPANCAFHLRTLAKYGFVEEAGGGRGRERPWRRTYQSMSWHAARDDSPASQAAAALDQVWLDRSLARARRGLSSTSRWPAGLDEVLGGSTATLYLTPAETGELFGELRQTFDRLLGPGQFRERRDPKLRPAGAVPIDFILFGYPVLDLPPLPGDEPDAAADEAGEAAARPGAADEDRPPEI
jgi:predicted transcriptional regulator